ncbi:MAG TPA: hypothetical protein VIN59_06995 [Alphaproteobacteria bacterium]
MNFGIALLVSSGSTLTLMASLAERLTEQGHPVHFIFDGSDEKVFAKLQSIAAPKRWPIMRYDMSDLLTSNATKSRAVRLAQKIIRKFAAAAPISNYHEANNRMKLQRAKKILQSCHTGLLIVGEDGVAGNCWLIGAAREMNIPVLDCPYEFSTRADFDNNMALKTELGSIIYPTDAERAQIEAIAPQWLKTGKYAGAVMFPPVIILAREALGLTLKDPWIVHGGLADHLAAEAKSTYASYIAEGIDPNKPVLTGSVYGDIVSTGLDADPVYRAAFDNNRKITPGITRILISWPTDYHADRGKHCEFADYKTLTETVLREITALPNAQVTLSLHPAAPDYLRTMVENIHPITSENILTLIPQHDLFITCGSSTMRWAVASAKPVINYDFYGFHLPDYDACPSVFQPRNFADFKTCLQALTRDDIAYAKAAKDQKRIAENWGMLDGKNFQRIYDLILTLKTPQQETDKRHASSR